MPTQVMDSMSQWSPPPHRGETVSGKDNAGGVQDEQRERN